MSSDTRDTAVASPPRSSTIALLASRRFWLVLLVGVLENLVGFYVAVEWKTAFAFSLIVIVLAIKPTGLMGTPVLKKV